MDPCPSTCGAQEAFSPCLSILPKNREASWIDFHSFASMNRFLSKSSSTATQTESLVTGGEVPRPTKPFCQGFAAYQRSVTWSSWYPSSGSAAASACAGASVDRSSAIPFVSGRSSRSSLATATFFSACTPCMARSLGTTALSCRPFQSTATCARSSL